MWWRDGKMSPLVPLLLFGLLRPYTAEIALTQQCDTSTDDTIYKYKAKALNGSHTVEFSSYVGKSILFINVATYWAYTFQYNDLNALQTELGSLGLVLLGFPSNQFGGQEPGQRHEILPGLKYVRPGNGFVPNFQLFEKGDVNGNEEQDFYTFLKKSCPPVGSYLGYRARLIWDPIMLNDIKWNFEKFLVGPDGKTVMRWHPTVPVSEVKANIKAFLLKL